ncbi:MAG: TetR/AcrR family transcriptional regulator [Deltaproteobacteria bacterium]|nr:TetR/AcrR family transcriptional regulator [Deltaproteobacteria bacterium]
MGETPSRILEAADDLFGQLGYDGVSMRDVARRAGVNKALVFYHFGGKDALFARVLHGYYEAHRLALESALTEELPVDARLHRVIDAYLDFIRENRHYARLVQRQVVGSEEHRALIEENLGSLFTWTEQALAEVAPEAGPLAARHFFVTMSGAVINYFTYGPALARLWGADPLSDEGIEERRAHLHWMLGSLLGSLAEQAE